MISGDFIPMDTSSVSNIIHLGGTILKSSRSDQFKTKEGRLVAYQKLQKANINNLIIIGGDGSFRGAKVFSDEHEDLNIIGIPKTIDNDISGTEYCIGYDTAINTAMKAIDKIRDTAESQNEVYIVEVMGRDAGYLAFSTGIVTGAEGILIPETSADYGYLKESFIKGWNRKKSSLIIVVAEGDERGKAIEIADGLKKYLQGREVRIVVLGHIQRGGSPTAFDRLLAARLGYSAVNALIENKKNMMVGFIKNEIHYTPLADICQIKMKVDNETLKLLKVLTS